MNKHTILWADDDVDDLELFRNVLHELTDQYHVLEFHNGRQVLDCLAAVSSEHYPCLIILDMNMPQLSGRETLSILKSESAYKNIPVIIFTTSSSEVDQLFCKRFETAMITKPPIYEKLKDIVKAFLEHCQH